MFSAHDERLLLQINPPPDLEPLICNFISDWCVGHEDTLEGQGLLYRELHILSLAHPAQPQDMMSASFSLTHARSPALVCGKRSISNLTATNNNREKPLFKTSQMFGMTEHVQTRAGLASK